MAARWGGIDLGGTKIEAIVADESHEVIGQSREQTPSTGGPGAVAEAMAQALAKAAEAAGIATKDLDGVGVGSPGDVDETKGTVGNARNLPDWSETFPLAETLADHLGTRVSVGNDVNVATKGEYELGAGKGRDSVLGVFWGTGVGGGLVLGGRQWLGRGGAGEIGHMVVRRNGAQCTCGRLGCMEAYAGRAAMEARARNLVKQGTETELFTLMEQRGRTRLTSAVWAKALDRDDELACDLIERAVKALGAGIASAVNLLDVEAVIIGGGLGVRFGEPMVKRIAKAMQPHLFNDTRPPDIRLAALGDLGGALGATLLAHDAAR